MFFVLDYMYIYISTKIVIYFNLIFRSEKRRFKIYFRIRMHIAFNDEKYVKFIWRREIDLFDVQPIRYNINVVKTGRRNERCAL